MKYQVKLFRTTERHVNTEKISSQVQKIAERAVAGQSGRGWVFSTGRISKQETNDGITYSVNVVFEKQHGHQSIVPKQWQNICIRLVKKCQSTSGSRPWRAEGKGIDSIINAVKESNDLIKIGSEDVVNDDKLTKDITEIQLDSKDYFDSIYDRDHQIKIVRSALVAVKESNLANRFHCVLWGPPGCGKTDVLKATGKMLGKDGEDYWLLDATSTTEAGIQKMLLSSKYIPPVLMIEEIEKTDEKSLRWLLGVLDNRAEVRKTNFRINHCVKSAKMLCLATVNDIQLFQKVMSGALYSRFAHNIFFPRPNKQIMSKILEREILKINGNLAWIEPTLKFCIDECKIDDPRKIIPICLCGKDDLLNGSYQESLLKTMSPDFTKTLNVK